MSDPTSVSKKKPIKNGRKKLDCFEILSTCNYQSIESICVSIQSQSSTAIDAFMSTHFLENERLLRALNQAMLEHGTDHKNKPKKRAKLLTAALLTILPFVNCSAKMRDLICAKYTDSQSINICNALVFALSLESPNIVSLACKTWIMSALTHIIETQHSRQISSKIKDAYHGLVKYCIQILQCQNLLCHLRVCDLFKLKQYAIRILLCELREGVMARQYLKDSFVCLIVLQTVIQMHDTYEGTNADANAYYDEYQWLMAKLFQFLYHCFDFSDLWITMDEYKNGIEAEALSHAAFDNSLKSHYLKSYLMVKAEFAQLLRKKCEIFMANTQGLFIKVAMKLLLEFPLNKAHTHTQTYFGPNWQYEFERILRTSPQWNESIVDHSMANIHIINTINIHKRKESKPEAKSHLKKCKKNQTQNCANNQNKSGKSGNNHQNKKKKHKKRHK